MEAKKHLMRVVTGEIIEFGEIKPADVEGFVFIFDAKFSHPVTFGGVEWTPANEMMISEKNIVYVLKKEE